MRRALVLLLASAAWAEPASGELCTTSGAVTSENGAYRVIGGSMRALAFPAAPRDEIEISFVSHGPSREVVPLANGEIRHQVGLKLRAEDGCNLLYVMWTLDPTPAIIVSQKRNTEALCGDRGYRTLAKVPMRAFLPGEPHVLRAEIENGIIVVHADEVVVRTPAPADLPGTGPVGLRSDNVAFDFTVQRMRVDPRAPSDCH